MTLCMFMLNDNEQISKQHVGGDDKQWFFFVWLNNAERNQWSLSLKVGMVISTFKLLNKLPPWQKKLPMPLIFTILHSLESRLSLGSKLNIMALDLRSFKGTLSKVICVRSLSRTPVINYTEVSTVVWKISNDSTASPLTCQLITSTQQGTLSINCCLCTCTTFTWIPFPSDTMSNLYLKHHY